MGQNHYSLLGLTPNALPAEIKKAFRQLSLKYHPDKTDNVDHHQLFLKVSRAYEVLRSPDTRRKYDMESGQSAAYTGPSAAFAGPRTSTATYTESFRASYNSNSYYGFYQTYNKRPDESFKKAEEEKRRFENERRKAEEEKRRFENERRKAFDQAKAESLRRADEERRRHFDQAEALRRAEEERRRHFDQNKSDLRMAEEERRKYFDQTKAESLRRRAEIREAQLKQAVAEKERMRQAEVEKQRMRRAVAEREQMRLFEIQEALRRDDQKKYQLELQEKRRQMEMQEKIERKQMEENTANKQMEENTENRQMGRKTHNHEKEKTKRNGVDNTRILEDDKEMNQEQDWMDDFADMEYQREGFIAQQLERKHILMNERIMKEKLLTDLELKKHPNDQNFEKLYDSNRIERLKIYNQWRDERIQFEKDQLREFGRENHAQEYLTPIDQIHFENIKLNDPEKKTPSKNEDFVDNSFKVDKNHRLSEDDDDYHQRKRRAHEKVHKKEGVYINDDFDQQYNTKFTPFTEIPVIEINSDVETLDDLEKNKSTNQETPKKFNYCESAFLENDTPGRRSMYDTLPDIEGPNIRPKQIPNYLRRKSRSPTRSKDKENNAIKENGKESMNFDGRRGIKKVKLTMNELEGTLPGDGLNDMGFGDMRSSLPRYDEENEPQEIIEGEKYQKKHNLQIIEDTSKRQRTFEYTDGVSRVSTMYTPVNINSMKGHKARLTKSDLNASDVRFTAPMAPTMVENTSIDGDEWQNYIINIENYQKSFLKYNRRVLEYKEGRARSDENNFNRMNSSDYNFKVYHECLVQDLRLEEQYLESMREYTSTMKEYNLRCFWMNKAKLRSNEYN